MARGWQRYVLCGCGPCGGQGPALQGVGATQGFVGLCRARCRAPRVPVGDRRSKPYVPRGQVGGRDARGP